MKLITAIIREHKLDQVRDALIAAEIFRITVTRCSGRGQQMETDVYRTQTVSPNLNPKVRLDIAVNETFLDRAIDAILKGAQSDGGEVGDGKIFVTPLDECIRIRTGERGNGAI